MAIETKIASEAKEAKKKEMILFLSNTEERELILHSLSTRWKKFSNVFESIKF